MRGANGELCPGIKEQAIVAKFQSVETDGTRDLESIFAKRKDVRLKAFSKTTMGGPVNVTVRSSEGIPRALGGGITMKVQIRGQMIFSGG